MAKMVEPVIALQKRITFLLNERDDHPALQKILDVIEMVLSIPLNTTLSKVIDFPDGFCLFSLRSCVALLFKKHLLFFHLQQYLTSNILKLRVNCGRATLLCVLLRKTLEMCQLSFMFFVNDLLKFTIKDFGYWT